MDTKNTPSLKENEVQAKIRTLYLEGYEVKEISNILGIPKGTIDNAYYLNHYDFRTFMLLVKKERMIKEAEEISRKILKMPSNGKNAKILAIQQRESEFIRETQGKDLGYSKRTETIGLNINKNEPLDDEQKKKLDNILQNVGASNISNVV